MIRDVSGGSPQQPLNPEPETVGSPARGVAWLGLVDLKEVVFRGNYLRLVRGD